MNCYVHAEASSIGTCVSCGKFICVNCNTELKGKNTCKRCVDEIFEENRLRIDKLESNDRPQQPYVFMNAAGGGGGSSTHVNAHEPVINTFSPSKNKVTAGLLAILLGGIGMHKIYLGKWLQGVLYFIFCWTYIPVFLGIIEGIRYLLLTDEDFARKYDQAFKD